MGVGEGDGPEHILDDVGTRLAYRVAVRYTMNFRTTSVRQNRAEALVKSIKKADAATVSIEGKRLGSGMDKFGEEEVDMHADAFQLAKSGVDPHAAFADMAASIPDVTSLLTKKKKKKGEDGNDADDEDGEDGSDAETPEGKPKRGDPTWWARDEYILAKETEVQALVSGDAEKFETAVKELKKYYQAACLHSAW